MRSMDILPANETTEVESRYYLNPQVALDESTSFIDNLRATQAQQNQQIAQDTYNLGSALPSSQGGLGTNTPAGLSYFTSRMQTPQTSSAVANLRATAQAAALNQALENEQAIWKKRYQDAYRAYQKRMNDKTNTPQNPNTTTLDVDTNSNTEETTELSQYQPGAGQIIPNTDYVSDYQDASTGAWYQLTSPREIDVIAVNNSLAGRNPSDGTTVTTPSGKTLRYVAATDSWYEQTNSAGPNTYSPRAR